VATAATILRAARRRCCKLAGGWTRSSSVFDTYSPERPPVRISSVPALSPPAQNLAAVASDRRRAVAVGGEGAA
jgi:hypothetical protein